MSVSDLLTTTPNTWSHLQVASVATSIGPAVSNMFTQGAPYIMPNPSPALRSIVGPSASGSMTLLPSAFYPGMTITIAGAGTVVVNAGDTMRTAISLGGVIVADTGPQPWASTNPQSYRLIGGALTCQSITAGVGSFVATGFVLGYDAIAMGVSFVGPIIPAIVLVPISSPTLLDVAVEFSAAAPQDTLTSLLLSITAG